MLSFLRSLFDDNKRVINTYQKYVEAINKLEPKMLELTDEDFPAYSAQFKARLQKGETLDDILVEAYALAREVAKRVLGLRMHDVQLLAAIAFHKGNVAEQKTGEGKTLSAVPALYLNALTGKGVHLVTVNDYLARVGTGWNGTIFNKLGLSVGVIYSGQGNQPAAVYDHEYVEPDQIDERLRHLRPTNRREAYAADITYGTNNEFGFDYLRDNMVQHVSEMVQRGHHFAIVDEVDSILIDEARTPLIISSPDQEPTDKYLQFTQLISELSSDTDYSVDEKFKTAVLTEHGILKVEKKLGIDNLYEKDFEVIHHIENALRARSLYQVDREYVIKDGQIIIVDEFTGRLMFGRRWSDGLHQAIEAKEGVAIQQESKTLATISFQNYFRMYEKLAGMTGTAATERDEFQRIYNLDVIVIPTHVTTKRKDHVDVIYKTVRAKYAAIADEIAERHANGQPVLVGTTSIDKNELVSKFLKRKNVPHNVLNAKNHEKEALIISNAGEFGAVTIATNIAGRGVDIVLGGATLDRSNFESEEKYQEAYAKWQEAHQKVLDAGGLFVIGTERHESRRIDNQLRGRAGRQGDSGGSRFYVSLEDDMMRIFGGEQISRMMTMLNMPEDMPLEHSMVSRAIEQAQVKVESFHFDSRKRVVEYDDVMNKQREIVYGRRRKVLDMVAAFEKSQDDSTEKNQDVNISPLKQKILDNLKSDIANTVAIYAPEGFDTIEYEKIVRDFSLILPLDVHSQNSLQEDLAKITDQEKITAKLQELISQVYELREKQFGSNLMRRLEVLVTLRTIDRLWIEHLDQINHLREGIGLRGYGQRDPLVEYKEEAFTLFERFLADIDYDIGRQIFRVGVNPVAEQKPIMPKMKMNREVENKQTVAAKKISRNDPCWCGSGKKWKKCHYPKTGE